GDGGGSSSSEEAAAGPLGRAQVFNTVVDTFLEKLVAVGSYQRFASCYRCFYKLQPEMTRSIYDQFISQLQASVKEEIREVKEEGNLDMLFNSLDKIVEEAKNQEEPAW
ncbi:PMF1 factor, partial [Atlantisia rogersi]|nr:PMF1 factor [Atlantisia rogersi]